MFFKLLLFIAFCFLLFLFLLVQRKQANHIHSTLRCRRVGARRRLDQSLNQPITHHALRLTRVPQLLVVELHCEDVAVLFPANREGVRNALERPQRRSRVIRSDRHLARLLRAHGVLVRVDHGDDADALIVDRRLDDVPVGVECQRIHQPIVAVVLVVQKLGIGLGPLVTPLRQVAHVPDHGVAVRVALNLDQADGEIFPDVLAQPQRRHMPAVERITLGRAVRSPANRRPAAILARRHKIAPQLVHGDSPEVARQLTRKIALRRRERNVDHDGRHDERKKERKKGRKNGRTGTTPLPLKKMFQFFPKLQLDIRIVSEKNREPPYPSIKSSKSLKYISLLPFSVDCCIIRKSRSMFGDTDHLGETFFCFGKCGTNAYMIRSTSSGMTASI